MEPFGHDAQRLHFQPFRASGQRAEAKLAAWRGDSILVVDPRDEAERPAWWIRHR